MIEKIVELIRRFAPMTSRSWEWDFLMAGSGRPQRWHEIEDERRVLIVADPGAGKTFEAEARARKMRDRGKKAFFIRIERIDASFDQAFEIGTTEEFVAWLGSTEEAWFFLDSVDEAQLETPRALEDAVRVFGARIHDALERTHIFITSRERQEKKNRADWVRALKADPDRILHPAGFKPGEFSRDQYYLLVSSMSDGLSISREDGANWQALVPEFGEPVARAYRDAAVAHWRAYRPDLRSEGAETGSTPYSLIFAMTGLAIEAAEDSAFAQRLTPDEARLAFRFVTWELNGFPTWFERLYRAFPEIGREAVAKELLWELARSVAGPPLHYILHDILYHAPWLHAEIAPLILDWLRTNEMPNADALRYCLNILRGGGTPPETLGKLAAERAQNTALAEQRPRWFALWVDTYPDTAIPALASALDALSQSDASAFAQQFIVGLLGDRHGTGTRVGAYRNAQDLKALYILMHRFIRVAEDIERAGKGVYSPTLRDDAQDARDRLFNMLVEVPGPKAHAAIKALEAEHPEPGYRRWMAVRARERATMDADEPLWTAEQVYDFAQAIVVA